MTAHVTPVRRDSTSRSLAPIGREELRGQSLPNRDRALDSWSLGAVAVLLGLGIVLVYSSSSVYAARLYRDAEHFLRLQLAWAGLGLAAMWLMTRVASASLRRRAGWVLIGCVLLCGVVLIPGIGHLAGGARRWLTFAGVGFQPSEFTKLAVVVVMAAVLARRDEESPEVRRSLLVPVALAQIPVLLILAEPDLGTALVIEIIVGIMVFVAGLRLRTLSLIGLAALPIFYHLVVGTPFRLQRLLSFIDPWAYRSTIGYQVTEALISIGSGGIGGVGLGEGKHKLFFLPEAHTDFVFAILSEELGLIGVVVLVTAFGVLVMRGVKAAARSTGAFDAYLAIGATALVAVPAVFNLLVATGLLPTKGLPLPLISYGGSNLVATLLAIGLVLRVERDSHTGTTWGQAT
jgi:cell division protein FtsW